MQTVLDDPEFVHAGYSVEDEIVILYGPHTRLKMSVERATELHNELSDAIAEAQNERRKGENPS